MMILLRGIISDDISDRPLYIISDDISDIYNQ